MPNSKVGSDWDVDQYRLLWDSDEQWHVRREFMLAHQKEIEEERLVCLAQVYANIEFLGCSYPPDLMEQVSELSQGLSTDHRNQKREREEIKFVKAKEAKANKDNNASGFKRKFEQTNTPHWDRPPASATAHLNRSNAASYFTAESSSNCGQQGQTVNKYQTQNYYTTSGYNSNLHRNQSGTALSSSQPSSWSFEAANSYGAGRGGGTGGYQGNGGRGNFGASRWTGHRSGEISSCRVPNSNTNDKNWQRPSKTSARQPVMKKQKLSGMDLVVHGFVIRESTNGGGLENPVGKLSNSAQFSKKTIQYQCDFISDTNGVAVHRCSVQLEGVEVASATDTTVPKAKIAAAEAALHRLSSLVPTVKVKQAVVSDGALSRNGVSGKPLGDDRIGNDNVGNKLLRLMGWSGGGLGASGREGITEPIKEKIVYGRQGFGLASQNGISPEFIRRFKQIISDYARSEKSKDLAFTSEFTKEERAEMHKIAQGFHLKSASHGKGSDRFLVISRKFRNTQQLVDHIVNEGGSTEKYELLLPGQHQSV